MEKTRKRHFGMMSDYIDTALDFGMSKKAIKEALKRNGVNEEIIRAVMFGNYVPYEPSDNMEKQIRESYAGREKLVIMNRHRREMWKEERKRRATGRPLPAARRRK